MIDLDKALRDLLSDDFVSQVEAMDVATDAVTLIASNAVKAFEKTTKPYLIAERLPRLGSLVIPELEKFVANTSGVSSEKTVLASIVLLSLGSEMGVEHVARELRERGPDEYLAALVLTKSGVPYAADLLIDRLRKFSLEELLDQKQSVYICNLLSHLHTLSVPLPEDLVETFDNLRSSPTHRYYSEYLAGQT